MAKNWQNKFARNTARFERRWELCGFYDENLLPHGGPEPGKTSGSEEYSYKKAKDHSAK